MPIVAVVSPSSDVAGAGTAGSWTPPFERSIHRARNRFQGSGELRGFLGLFASQRMSPILLGLAQGTKAEMGLSPKWMVYLLENPSMDDLGVPF